MVIGAARDRKRETRWLVLTSERVIPNWEDGNVKINEGKQFNKFVLRVKHQKATSDSLNRRLNCR
jgi:hypothetical protein